MSKHFFKAKWRIEEEESQINLGVVDQGNNMEEEKQSDLLECRKVYENVKRIISMEAIGEKGISYSDFMKSYEKIFGKPLNIQDLNYKCIEEFISYGLGDLLEIDLLGGLWKIVPVGSQIGAEERAWDEQFEVTRQSLISLFEIHPYGMSLDRWLAQFSRLEDFPVSAEMLLEVALQSPDICILDTSQSELSILPAGYKFHADRYWFPLYRLATPKRNVKQLLDSLNQRVPLSEFQQRYIDQFGNPNVEEVHASNFLGLCSLMPDLCSLHHGKHKKDRVMIEAKRASLVPLSQKQRTENGMEYKKFPEDLLYNLRVVSTSCRYPQLGLKRKYQKIIGKSLNFKDLGYKYLVDFLKDLHGKHGFNFEQGRLRSNVMINLLPVKKQQDLTSGLVEVVAVETCRTVKILPQKDRKTIGELEREMELFYSERSQLEGLEERDCVAGQSVAAVYEDCGLYRARILRSLPSQSGQPRLLEVLYVDHGWRALVRQSHVFRLKQKFCRVPELLVALTLSSTDPACSCSSSSNSQHCSNRLQLKRELTSGAGLSYLHRENNKIHISSHIPGEVRDPPTVRHSLDVKQASIKLVIGQFLTIKK